MNKIVKGMSLFSSCGVGEYYLERSGINIVVANELLPKRADLYRKIYPKSTMICGDISEQEIFKKVEEIAIKEKVEFMIASPPCQGFSVAGKNRSLDDFSKDDRNYLIKYVVKMIQSVKPKFIIIENVPSMLKLQFSDNGEKLDVLQYLNKVFQKEYNIEADILDTSNYGTPQRRKRAIIKLTANGLEWKWPQKNNKIITVNEAIGDLPSLESGEISNIKWHFARNHDTRQVEWMRHTPTGHSAFENEEFYPVKKDGSKIKGYNSSYRRIKWDEPAPTITIRNDAISSQRNVHPGHKLKSGLYSDARVLSILELIRLTGLPDEWPIPINTSEILVRQVLGECIPPLLVEAIAKEIFYE